MNLKKLRAEHGFEKQKDLAKCLGINVTVLSMWETGKSKPKLDTIKRLAEILQVSVEEILNCF